MTYEIAPVTNRNKAVSRSYEGEQLIFNKDEPSAAAKQFVSTTVHDAIVEIAGRVGNNNGGGGGGGDGNDGSFFLTKRFAHFQDYRSGSAGAANAGWNPRKLTRSVIPQNKIVEINGVKAKLSPTYAHMFSLPGPATYRITAMSTSTTGDSTLKIESIGVTPEAHIANDSVKINASNANTFMGQYIVAGGTQKLAISGNGGMTYELFSTSGTGYSSIKTYTITVDSRKAGYIDDCTYYFGVTGKAPDGSTLDASFTNKCIYFIDKYPNSSSSTDKLTSSDNIFVYSGYKNSSGTQETNMPNTGVTSTSISDTGTTLTLAGIEYTVWRAEFSNTIRSNANIAKSAPLKFYWVKDSEKNNRKHGYTAGEFISVKSQMDGDGSYEVYLDAVEPEYKFYIRYVTETTLAPTTKLAMLYDTYFEAQVMYSLNVTGYETYSTGVSTPGALGSTACHIDAIFNASKDGDNWFAMHQHFGTWNSKYETSVVGIANRNRPAENIYANVLCERVG